MLRGINKQDIFFNSKDYLKFQEIIKKSKEVYSYKLYSYVIMPNHIHLEIKDEEDKLSQIIHSITTSYATYFNKKYQRTGHVFENRFLSKNVENSYYILNLVRYIHQNPEKAGICLMNQYKWSSYIDYFQPKNKKNENKMIDTEEILSIFSTENNQIKQKFLEYNKNIVEFQESKDLLEYEIRKKLTDNELIYFIKEKLKIDNIQEIQRYNVLYRNKLIKKIKEINGTTQKQIARVLGINIITVQRALKNKKSISKKTNLSQN